MNKTDNSTASVATPRKPAAKIPTREMSLSLFESGLSYMLEAGWKITAEKARDADGVNVVTLRIAAADFALDNGEIALFEDVPLLAHPPDIIGTPTIVTQ